jgi:hypothetical protein
MTMPEPQPSELITLCRTARAAEAHAIAGRLRAAGIEARVVGDFLGGGYGGLAAGGMSDSEVWIAAADRDAATAVLNDVPAMDSPPPEPFKKNSWVGPRFSLLSLLVVLTLAAVLAAADAVQPGGIKAYSEMLYLLLSAAIVGLIYRRWQRVYATPSLDDEA